MQLRLLVNTTGRYLLLVVLVGVGHLSLLWLWDPVVSVQAPRIVKVDSPHPVTPGETVVVFGGDTAPTDAASPMLRLHGFEYPFGPTLGVLRRADLAVVNLEAAVTELERSFPLYKRYIYKVHPSGLAALKWAGVGAVTLANNHVLDYGVEGFADTMRQLKHARVVPIGGGASVGEARRGVVFDIRGTRVGVLGYMEDTLMHSLYVRSFAGLNRPGCARLGARAVVSDIARIRRAADLVVVSVHWGRNYRGITASQRYYGKLMVDAGADVVIGHGPHIHQPVGSHNGRPIVYSVGNYAFGTPGRPWFRHGLLARLRIRGGRLARLELVPLLVQNRIVRFQPRRLFGAKARQMLHDLAKESAKEGATIRVESSIAAWEG